MTITCTYWRNPIYPQVSTGYTIKTYDINQKEMEVSENFVLDTTSFAPKVVDDLNVAYILGTGIVQQDTSYKVEVTSPVPFQLSGCYVKFNFPNEL